MHYSARNDLSIVVVVVICQINRPRFSFTRLTAIDLKGNSTPLQDFIETSPDDGMNE